MSSSSTLVMSGPPPLPDDVSSSGYSCMPHTSPDNANEKDLEQEAQQMDSIPENGAIADEAPSSSADSATRLSAENIKQHELQNRKTPCRCKTECITLFKAETELVKLSELRFNLDALRTDERNKHVFNMVRQLVQSDEKVLARTQYALLSRPVCQPTYSHLTGISKNKIAQVKEQLLHGHVEAPRLRLTRNFRPREDDKSSKADAWFLTIYETLAQPYADADEGREGDQLKDPLMEEVVSADHPLYLLAAGADGDRRTVPLRRLPPMKFEDLWMMHSAECGEDRVSKETLRMCWRNRWSKYMPIREVGTQGRCPICAEICEERKGANDHNDDNTARTTTTTDNSRTAASSQQLQQQPGDRVTG